MSYVILDLEWNGSYSKVLHKFVNEIIEIGAVKLDDELNVCDTFTMLVAPKIGKKLCSKVKQLTKITNEELKDEGVSFIRAISLFSDFLGDGVLMTWSDSDLHALIETTATTRAEPDFRFSHAIAICKAIVKIVLICMIHPVSWDSVPVPKWQVLIFRKMISTGRLPMCT